MARRIFLSSFAVLALILSLPTAFGLFNDVSGVVLGVGIQAGDWVAPNAPTFWVEEDTTQAKLEWFAVSDATSYKVYRSTDNTTFNLLTTVVGVTEYTDTTLVADTNYYYKVSSVDAASNETSLASITGKFAGAKEVVIDDNAMTDGADLNSSGGVTSTGAWGKYAVRSNGSDGVGVYPDILQNAVGGDNHSTNGAASGQTFTWSTPAALNGTYEVFAQYICDPSRGNAVYKIYSGATQVGSSVTKSQALLANGSACGSQASGNTESQWVSLGSFSITDTGKIELTAETGQNNIIADAVAFKRTGDAAPVVNPAPYVKIDAPSEGNTVSGTVEVRGTVTDNDPKHYWLVAQKVGGGMVSGFPGTVNRTTSFTNEVIFTWDTTKVVNGQYIIKLEARDMAGNKDPNLAPVPSDPESATDSVDWITVTVNNTVVTTPPNPPMSYITVANSAAQRVENRISNGSFESDLASWNVSGDVALLSGSDGFTLPQQGSKMVKIGRNTNEGSPARVNTLTQQIPAGVRTMGFYYNMFTYDYAGFDDPGFMVFVNDKMVFQRWASEIDRDDPVAGTTNLDSSGWQYFGIDLSKYPEGTTVTLAFYAGNDNTNTPSGTPHQTWVYVDNFSTNEAIVNAASQFQIHTLAGDTAYYRIGSDPTVHTGSSFTLSAQPANQTIYYWSGNGTETEPTNSFHVLYDNVAPDKVTTLGASNVENNLFNLQWLSPRDDNQFTAPNSRPTNAAGYEIRYSTSPIADNADWNTLSTVDIVTEDGLPAGGYRAPRPEGEQEQYFVRTADSATDYYFVVRAYDAATNTSVMSNVAHVNLAVAAPINNNSDIVINEFIPNPTGDDTAGKPAGEWVELYNKSSADIDVNGWALYDADDAHELVISAGNSDNNLNTDDGGETVVPAHGYLVVYRNGDTDFDLDDAGDSVRLYNKPITAPDTTLVDTHTYSSAVPENKSYARIPEGTGDMIDPVPTPGRPNAKTEADLTPQARIWSQKASTAKFSLFDAVNYDKAEYTIEYTYSNEGQPVQGGLTGSVDITDARHDVKDLYFGTCSTGGTCVPHQGVVPSSVTLKLVLTGANIPDRNITQQLTGSWAE